jgi:ABC-type Na+ transport system ATPase subunit NatA
MCCSPQVKLLASLVDCQGNILIDGVDATVAPVTEEEKVGFGRG